MKHTIDPPTDRVIPLREPETSPPPTAPATDFLQIGEVAEQTGLTQRTLRS